MLFSNTKEQLSLPRPMLRQSWVGAVLVLALGFANLTSASTAQTYQIKYAKSELTTQRGAQAVHERIRQVAKNHCPAFSQSRSLKYTKSCIAEVTEELVSQVNHPRLTAVHNGDLGRSIAAR